MLRLIALVLILGSVYYLFPLAKVIGHSMHPTLHDGDIILCCRIPVIFEIFKANRMYVFQSESGVLAIKRLRDCVTRRPSLKKVVYLLGDNPEESYDSRQYGYIKAEHIVAVVLWHKTH